MKTHTRIALALVASLMASTAWATDTTGTWYSYPPQTFNSSDIVTHGFAYQTAVRPPINADGSSNWSSRRGVIPVQFDLLAAPNTTTTTTKTYDPPVWQSLLSDGSVSYAGLLLSPTVTFNDITNLSATYAFTAGDCRGGSLRWDVYVDGAAGVIRIYYGNPNGSPNPPGQSCVGNESESTKNLISDPTVPANRFEIGNNNIYTTYAAALAATNGGTDHVVGVQLTLDSGWGGDQIAEVSNVTVNDNTWVPKTTETTTTTTVDGPYAHTCTLPAAELRWALNNPNPTGAVNEAESIQPKDTGQFFRQVDCKYIYNLDVTSLNGKGTYTVWARIGGVNITVPATFDLK
jgi:hypothetical protein